MTTTSMSVRWTVFCLLLRRLTALDGEMQCSVLPAGALHPVRALLERFQAGLGCAARESGDTETHVVSAGGRKNMSNDEVTLVLRHSGLSPPRTVHLLLSSRTTTRWRLDSDGLDRLTLKVLVSSPSSVRSDSLDLNVRSTSSLPSRPRALQRWTLQHLGGLSSLTHLAQGNRVYIRLGEDPSLPAVCRLQSNFLSENHVTSDLRPQEVLGCVSEDDGDSPEIHVIKLHSAGSSLCGSLQVEVSVSLLPPPDASSQLQVVLVLSSSVPVHWAIAAPGVRGRVLVHSSHSVSPPHPPEPHLTLSTSVDPDLSSVSDLLLWTRDHGYHKVASYTEASLANRFLVQLAGSQDTEDVWSVGERQSVRQQRLSVQCEDGRLSVMMDAAVLQSLSVSVVTLQDPACRAQSNGRHFLLVFPVISCGTEGSMQAGSVQYQNTVLLWRDDPRTKRSSSPLSVAFTCTAPYPGPPAHWDEDGDEDLQPGDLTLWSPPGPGPRPGPGLHLDLFASESFERRHSEPCVVAPGHRVYVQVSVTGRVDSAEVESCVVSPHPDPKLDPVWDLIRQGCSVDPTLEEEGEGEEEEGRRVRFSFGLPSLFDDPLQFLHCRLQLCGSEEEVLGRAQEDEDCHGGRLRPLVSSEHKSGCETRILSSTLVVSEPGRWEPQRSGRRGRWEEDEWVRTGSLVGVVSAAFLLGVGLMVALWCSCSRAGADSVWVLPRTRR